MNQTTVLLKEVRKLRGIYPEVSLVPVTGKKATCEWEEFQINPASDTRLASAIVNTNATGIALLSGLINGGLVCRDFDTEHEFRQWQPMYPQWSSCLPQVKTFRGGHVWFRTSTKYLFSKKFNGGEYRGTSGLYALIPPSIHPSGVPYQWICSIPDNGVIPFVEDPITAGLLPSRYNPTLSSPDKHYNTKNNSTITLNTNSKTLDLDSVCGCYMPRVPQSVVRLSLIHAPTRYGHRHIKILDYVRSLRRLEMRWTEPQLKVSFGLWWTNAIGAVETKSKDFSFFEFCQAWRTCPLQTKGLDVERVLQSSEYVALPNRFDGYKDNVRTLVKVCLFLQTLDGKDFYISGEDAGRLVGVSQVTGGKMLKRLCEDGVLIRTEKGSNFTGKSSYYRMASWEDCCRE